MEDFIENLEKYLEKYEEICDVAKDALVWYNLNIATVEGIEYLSLSSITMQEACFEGEETWNYGGHESYGFELNIRYLYDEEFKQQQKEIAIQKLKDEQNKITLKAKKDAELYEKRQYQKYLKLQKKFAKEDIPSSTEEV